MDARGKDQVRRVYLRSLYDCEKLCGRTLTEPGRIKDRAACRCSLPGFDAATWDRRASLGAAEEAEQIAESLRVHIERHGLAVDFDLDTDGCPWGWVVSRFATSVMDYVGSRDADSRIRSQNPRLWRRTMRDEEEPTRLLGWVRYAERIEDATFDFYHEVVSSL